MIDSIKQDKKEKKMERKLTYIGFDSWGRPVYEDQTGILFVDTYPISGCPMELCTKNGNKFDGEPDTPICYTRYSDDTFTVNHRKTWR